MNTIMEKTLVEIAGEILNMIHEGLFDELDLGQLLSETGLHLDFTDRGYPAVCAWAHDELLTVWAGNEHDFDMTHIVEVSL